VNEDPRFPSEPPSTTTGALVLPCPNLGPEPLDRPGGLSAWTIVAALGLIASATTLWMRRRLRARNGPQCSAKVDTNIKSNIDPIILCAQTAREALVARFGDDWRARTTEEIEAEPLLLTCIGAQSLERLVSLLRAADLAKFASVGCSPPDPESPGEIAAWEEWVAGFVAGARSTINGK
jgi:hypothetical protein